MEQIGPPMKKKAEAEQMLVEIQPNSYEQALLSLQVIQIVLQQHLTNCNLDAVFYACAVHVSLTIIAYGWRN